ncbi:MAG: transposase family protein [Actinomycetes bacterium]
MSVSSLIPRAVDQCQSEADLLAFPADGVPADLLAALSQLTDPRGRRGVRHPLAVVPGIAVCAVLAGARSFVAISECAADLPLSVRRAQGVMRVVPCESTIRRVLERQDPTALDR